MLATAISTTSTYDPAIACKKIMDAHDLIGMIDKDEKNFDQIVLLVELLGPTVSKLYEHLAGF